MVGRNIENASTMTRKMNELATPLKDFPPVEFSCAYGSRVFPHIGLART